MRIGHGFDAHRLVEGRALVLGGVTRAVRARRAGALGRRRARARDLPTRCSARPRLAIWAAAIPGQRSALEGRRFDGTARALRAGGAEPATTIVNVDATIVVDRPKLAPHRRGDARERRAVLALPVELALSVKAKSSEGMGYTGDGSGIAAYAVALLNESDAMP